MHHRSPTWPAGPASRLVGILLAALAVACTSGPSADIQDVPDVSFPERTPVALDDLAVEVHPEENRHVSFTNKRSAFYFTQTHRNDHPEHAWFRGLNVAKRRIFSGYELARNGVPLDRAAAEVTVYPDRLVRRYPGGEVEVLRLFDDRDVVEVELAPGGGPDGAQGEAAGAGPLGSGSTLSMELLGDQVTPHAVEGGVAYFHTTEAPGTLIAVGSRSGTPVTASGRTTRAVGAADATDATDPTGTRGFLIALGDSREAARTLLDQARDSADTWARARRTRMTDLLEGPAYLRAADDSLTRALRWITLNLDQLVTRQQGDGIYAGLPWFNEYWGRDSFISLPGATLVTGNFEAARRILTSFAAFQETDPESEFYGRLPNIVNPELVDYHTTDGTPRFVIQLLEYVRYSGDTTLVRELYPTVERSIEGSLANWTDSLGYLVHADNETWMDARRAEDLVPYSPRGTRANDIQALWYGQLRAGVWLARFVGEAEAADRWDAAADRVREAFRRDFVRDEYPYVADRLTAQGIPEWRLRPNLLYAWDLLPPDNSGMGLFRTRVARMVWQELVYPWGVASLERDDPFFHPYHLSGGRYHKDQAYHNGTVWLWNNGAAMERVIQSGAPDVAWRLFENMNRQALTRGVVGGLAENADAYPEFFEGTSVRRELPKLTGTYLQAWSNAEHLRVWHQRFLGIRPDMVHRLVTLAPRLPEAVDSLDYAVRLGDGRLRGSYREGEWGEENRWDQDGTAGAWRHTYRWEADPSAAPVSFLVDVPPFPLHEVELDGGWTLVLERAGHVLTLTRFDEAETVVEETPLQLGLEGLLGGPDGARRRTLGNPDFARPFPDSVHPVMRWTGR